MGIDIAVLQILCCAKSIGADFSETMMIGRQTINEDPRNFAADLRAVGVSQEDAESIGQGEFSERLFNSLGAREVCSLDASDYEQATYVCDLNNPSPEDLVERFSLVLDGGALEHVFNLPQALKNCMEMVRVGGHFIQVTTANNYMGHGFWQFSPEAVFRVFSPENGFSTKAVFLREVVPDGQWYQVLDPAVCRQRVELVNDRPTYICTIAQRVAKQPVFSVWPQQSDYVALWQPDHAPENAAAEHRRESRRRISDIVAAGLRRTRLLPKSRPSPFDRSYYRRVSAHDLVRGQFAAATG